MQYRIQKYIRDEIALMSRDEIIARIAFLDTILESDSNDLQQVIGCTRNDIKSLKSKLVSQLKKTK